MPVTAKTATDATAIRPFTIETPESDLADLRARIVATRFPEKETVDDASQGPQLEMMQAVARYLG
jgi:Epoxide hydrolase N terminus